MRLVLLIVALSAMGSAGAQEKSRGAAVYTQSCVNATARISRGDSGPPLTGQMFQQAYGTGTAAQLYDFISRQMPQDKPGTLSQQQYLDVTAYFCHETASAPATHRCRSRHWADSHVSAGMSQTRARTQHRRNRACRTAGPQGLRSASGRG